ncbi:MAG: inorganic pyrophosphatase Ppa [Desulfobacterales bacterium]|nr:MAG: inorganic pyrophosphatase Ppa [Desulfobacterales bacterium]
MSILPLDSKEKFEIQTYGKATSVDRDTHVPFSGSPRKHPWDPERFILVADPFTHNTFYFEFKISDIGCAEELPSMTNIDGESVPMARIWVAKKSVGIRCTPFAVDEIDGEIDG